MRSGTRLKSTSNDNFNLLWEFLPEICWKEVAEEIFSYFRFDVWSNKATHYLLDYGNFKEFKRGYLSVLLRQTIFHIHLNRIAMVDDSGWNACDENIEMMEHLH